MITTGWLPSNFLVFKMCRHRVNIVTINQNIDPLRPFLSGENNCNCLLPFFICNFSPISVDLRFAYRCRKFKFGLACKEYDGSFLHKTACPANLNTSLTLNFVFAQHSMYSLAPVSPATRSACKQEKIDIIRLCI